MDRIIVTGADQLGELAKRLRQAGRKDLLDELGRAIRKKAGPLRDAAKREVQSLPSRGTFGSGHLARADATLAKAKRVDFRTAFRALAKSGLRRRVASTVKLSVIRQGKKTGVRITSEGTRMPPGQQKLPKHMNRGNIRHPVFGDDEVWVDQRFRPGWFDRPIQAGAPGVREEIIDAMRRVGDLIERD